jgi:hypothetical protein
MLSSLSSSDLIHNFDLINAVEESIRCGTSGCQVGDPARRYAVMAIAEAQKYVVALCPQVLSAADGVKSSDQGQANHHLVEVVWGVEWLLKASQALERVFNLDFSTMVLEGKTIANILRDLRQTIAEIQSAHEQHQVEIMRDLLEYELAPHLELTRAVFSLVGQKVAPEAEGSP